MLAPNINNPVHISGDEDKGFATDYDLRAGAVAQGCLVYHGKYAGQFPERELRCEVYVNPETGNLYLSTLCVRCGEHITLHNHGLRFEHKEGEPFALIYTEPFVCPWELIKNRRVSFGIGLCKAKVAYHGRVIKDD